MNGYTWVSLFLALLDTDCSNRSVGLGSDGMAVEGAIDRSAAVGVTI
jgi:hypothetical protein